MTTKAMAPTILNEYAAYQEYGTPVMLAPGLCGALHLLPTYQARAALSDQASKSTLSNGLREILLENHKAPLVTFQVWYRVGSRNEARGKTGLSHMLDHMMFKGTEKVGPGA